MATWVTHLMIADGILKRFPSLDKRGFCIGNIAPDCNVENEDWTAFTPFRKETYWIQEKRKKGSGLRCLLRRIHYEAPCGYYQR